jgi:hypothetical protein
MVGAARGRPSVGGPAVVVGAGLTGTAISHSLSNAGIPHVVIGRAPDALPRLGESLNLEGTLLLDEFCGEFSSFFQRKSQGVFFVGGHVLQCPFDVARGRRARALFRLLGVTAPAQFLHIDRGGLDAAMYERMTKSAWCRVLDVGVAAVRHDAAADRVVSIELSDGSALAPSYVFDASNHKRVVAQAIGVPVRALGAPQRVVYARYHPPTGSAPLRHRPTFDASTNLLRLFRAIDGVDALAWYIPLPGYVSIGVSADDGSHDLADDELLDAVAAAYERRGLRFRDRYPQASPTMALRYRDYLHGRAYGANWSLAGGTYLSVSWMAGAGVGTSFAAARMAPALIADPLRAGSAYEAYLDTLLPIQATFAWFASTALDGVDAGALRAVSDRFVHTNLARLGYAARLGGGLPALAGRGLALLARKERVIRDYCDVFEAPLAEQTERAFGPQQDAAGEAVVLRLAEIIAGRADIDASDALLDERVVSHLDAWTATGRPAWRAWLRFLRSRRRAAGFDLVDVSAEVLADGRIRLSGRWRTPDGVADDLASATYRLSGGRIVEIWTTRRNYVFLLGPLARSRIGMALIIARLGVASLLAREAPSP